MTEQRRWVCRHCGRAAPTDDLNQVFHEPKCPDRPRGETDDKHDDR